jgi:hypothetical protein
MDHGRDRGPKPIELSRGRREVVGFMDHAGQGRLTIFARSKARTASVRVPPDIRDANKRARAGAFGLGVGCRK